MKRKKLILIVAAASVAVAGAAGAGAYWWYKDQPPDPKTATPEEVLAYVASERFTNQSDERKQEYFDTMQKESKTPPHEMMRAAQKFPDKEREALHKNMGSMFQARMRQEINHYFELPAEERVAYLDNIIDRFEQHGPPPGDRRPPDANDRGNGNGPGRHGPHGHHSRSEMREHFKQMLKHTSGRDQTRMMEFMQDMRKRRQERGLPDRPHGPRH